MKWFKNINSIEELKRQYKKLAVEHHPDMGGSTEEMQEINNEYDILFVKYRDIHEKANGETYTRTNVKPEEVESPEQYKEIINRLIHFTGCKIEICGSWIWVSGATYLYKDELKALRFRWSPQKIAWYFKPEDYRKRTKKKFTLDEIRGMYGSNEFQTTEEEKRLE